MEIFFVIAFGIAGASLLSVAWIWGCLVDVVCTPNGPKPLRKAAIINCVICALVFGVTAKLLDAPTLPAILLALLAGAACLVQPLRKLLTHGETARIACDMAPLIETYFGKHFNELDTNRDGIITEVNLDDAIEHGRSSFCEPEKFRALMRMALEEVATLGHVIYTEEHPEPFTSFTGGGPPITTVVNQVTYVYGISRGDEVGFAKKIATRYCNWVRA